ncbi:MAG: adenylate/guanylate cyclase domain-containing protein, partial [Saprospiraceae bacterium]|nr:adenylate/guanylate cyclase domain-containing protein [Saprospiraceae bacterium]
MKHSRRLAVIMFTDIVGYTALMSRDEHGAMELLEQNRVIQIPLIGKFGGRMLKEIGDGMLASFDSSSHAVACASAIQSQAIGQNILLRVGIHQGEVVEKDDDIFGDGVNIASRIEQICKPGQVFISEAVHHDIVNKTGFHCNYVGEHHLKNVGYPWKIYSVVVDSSQLLEMVAEQSIFDEIEKSPWQEVDSSTEKWDENIIESLWRRGILQIVAGYLVVGVILLLVLDRSLEHFLMSPYWVDVLLVLL